MGRQENMTNYELKSQGTINQQIICEGFFLCQQLEII